MGPTTTAAGRWSIPAPVLRTAAGIVVALAVPLVVVGAWAGSTAAMGMVLGYIGAIGPALSVSPRSALALAVPAAMTGAVATSLSGQAFPAACFVALACLLIAPANMVRNGLSASLPTIAAVLATYPSSKDPVQVAGWMLGGSAVAVLVLARLRRPSEPVGLDQRTAWLHAITMAAATGVTVLVLVWFEVPHGYWIAMTLTVVLRPYGAETSAVAGQRVLGTVGGAAVALALAVLVPGWVALAVAILMLVPVLGYAVLGRYAQQVVFLTPMVILPGSGGAGVAAADLALSRVGATLLGAVLAAGLALALTRVDRTHSSESPDGAPEVAG
jgi:hypothetical protein